MANSEIPAYYSARPTIKIEGKVDQRLLAECEHLLVEETADGICRCEIAFNNWGPDPAQSHKVGFLYFDRKLLDFGKKVEVEMGAGAAKGTVFVGRITGIEARMVAGGPFQILVLAEDRLQDLRMTRRTRTWEKKTDAEIMKAIASGHGLSPTIQIQGPVHACMAQVNQSDLAFMRERARVLGAEIWVEDAKLTVKPRTDRGKTTVTLKMGERLWQFKALADLAHQRTAVVVSGWNVAGKQAVSAEATEKVVSGELDGATAGAKILQAKLGARKETIVHTGALTKDEAKAYADAAFRRIARRFVTGEGECEGDGRIRVGAKVKVTDVGALFTGTYFVTEARHLFDTQGGYRTQFRVERPGIGGSAT